MFHSVAQAVLEHVSIQTHLTTPRLAKFLYINTTILLSKTYLYMGNISRKILTSEESLSSWLLAQLWPLLTWSLGSPKTEVEAGLLYSHVLHAGSPYNCTTVMKLAMYMPPLSGCKTVGDSAWKMVSFLIKSAHEWRSLAGRLNLGSFRILLYT